MNSKYRNPIVAGWNIETGGLFVNAIVEGGTLVTMGPQGIVRNGAIVVENDEVVEIGRLSVIKPKYRGYERI
ncbi:MAG: hypothetical protein NWE78_08185, partial [Candidatus Bathyarchaeota archaeon]|nr:hypothetical protein [Candidatus Bathyarchaeota archaeon]